VIRSVKRALWQQF